MALVQKNDIKQIFADQAPSIDKPATFANYPRGWDTARPNNGKPTIKQFNYLQQRTDQNILWMHQNGAALPYDSSMEYEEGAVVVKDGKLQQKQGDSWVNVGVSTAAELMDESGKNQQEINDKTNINVSSLSNLIAIKKPKDNAIVAVLSYYHDKNMGGDLFIWRNNISKSLHDGGYVIDPLITIPSLATFSTYYTPKNTGVGVWVRLTKHSDVSAENYGLNDNPSMVWNCAAIQQAIAKAIELGSNVLCGAGTFKTTNPIFLCNFTSTSSYSHVPLIIGAGEEKTIFKKVSTSTVSSLHPVDSFKANVDIDAVVFTSPLKGKLYLMYGGLSKLSLNRYDNGVVNSPIERGGYCYYAHSHIYRDISNVVTKGGNIGYYTFDCWMSSLNRINTERVISWGFYIDGGTSQTGKNLYVVGSEGGGVKINGLQYSNLEFSADGCGGGSANMGWLNAQDTNTSRCYEVTASRGVVAFMNAEVFAGKTPFYFHNSKAIKVSGNTWAFKGAKANGDPMITISNSIVDFSTYDFNDTYREAFVNYHSLYYRSGGAVNLSSVQLSPNFTDYTLGAASTTNYVTNIKKSDYIEQNGQIDAVLTLSNSTFAKIAYISAAKRIFPKSLVAIRATYDRFYTFDPLGIAVSAISTNSTMPTTLSLKCYRDGVEYAASFVHGYVSNGWLYIKCSDGGNSLEYNLTLLKSTV